jgi:hypothetical protein
MRLKARTAEGSLIAVFGVRATVALTPDPPMYAASASRLWVVTDGGIARTSAKKRERGTSPWLFGPTLELEEAVRAVGVLGLPPFAAEELSVSDEAT